MKVEKETNADLLTTQEFAQAMRTSRRNIRRWIARGVIRPDECVRPGGRTILICREALRRLTTPEKTPSATIRRRPRADAKTRAAYDLMNLEKTLAKVGGKKTGKEQK